MYKSGNDLPSRPPASAAESIKWEWCAPPTLNQRTVTGIVLNVLLWTWRHLVFMEIIYMYMKEINYFFIKPDSRPGQWWLSGLSASLRTKDLLVWFPVRAHAWVVGQVPSTPTREATTCWCFSPSLSLKINKIFKKKNPTWFCKGSSCKLAFVYGS